MAGGEEKPADTPAAAAEAGEAPPEWQARRLLRAARVGTLATSADGQPFASLVTPTCAPDLSVLMLLSDLSEHTRHLTREPRCALLVAGPAAGPNPQTAPRLTLTGTAARIVDAELKRRWLAVHPYAAMYADFGDFALWRIAPASGLLVGGFARAHRLRQSALLPDAAAVAAVAAAEPAVLAHCNADHADALAKIARAAGGEGGSWRMVAADVDGCDLAGEEAVVLRIAWSQPVAEAREIRAELVRLVETGA